MKSFIIVLLSLLFSNCYAYSSSSSSSSSTSTSPFPSGFVFGTATAAYQIEGAYQQDNRLVKKNILF